MLEDHSDPTQATVVVDAFVAPRGGMTYNVTITNGDEQTPLEVSREEAGDVADVLGVEFPSIEADIHHAEVVRYLDSTGGTMDVLANAVHAADEAGFYVESLDDKRADVENHLQRAFEEVDSDDPDASFVYDEVTSARSTVHTMMGMIDENLEDFELPDHVDSGVYDTFGEYLEYVHSDLGSVTGAAERWDVAAG